MLWYHDIIPHWPLAEVIARDHVSEASIFRDKFIDLVDPARLGALFFSQTKWTGFLLLQLNNRIQDADRDRLDLSPPKQIRARAVIGPENTWVKDGGESQGNRKSKKQRKTLDNSNMNSPSKKSKISDPTPTSGDAKVKKGAALNIPARKPIPLAGRARPPTLGKRPNSTNDFGLNLAPWSNRPEEKKFLLEKMTTYLGDPPRPSLGEIKNLLTKFEPVFYKTDKVHPPLIRPELLLSWETKCPDVNKPHNCYRFGKTEFRPSCEFHTLLVNLEILENTFSFTFLCLTSIQKTSQNGEN